MAVVVPWFETACLHRAVYGLLKRKRNLDLPEGFHYLYRAGGAAVVVKYWTPILLTAFIIPLILISPLLWFAYLVGRVFLVVESFRQLAFAPPGVFVGAGWPGWVPHLGSG